MLGPGPNSRFKSNGEKRIAHFLDSQSIHYQYEQGVLVRSTQGQPRIVYPDFYLPEFKTYLEYYGMAGHPDYDRGIKRKEAMYAESGLDVIPVYPWMFAEDWQGYVMRALKNTHFHRYRTLQSKPYWSRRSPPGYHQPQSRMPGYRSHPARRY